MTLRVTKINTNQNFVGLKKQFVRQPLRQAYAREDLLHVSLYVNQNLLRVLWLQILCEMRYILTMQYDSKIELMQFLGVYIYILFPV